MDSLGGEKSEAVAAMGDSGGFSGGGGGGVRSQWL